MRYLSPSMFQDQDTAVSKFYENRSTFITGATGFIGKVLLEKLLRSCPGIKNIYILIREKKGKSPKQRCEELLNCKLFDLVKKVNPEAIKKVVVVTGDITLTFLGLSESDMATLIKNVSIVFHSAATIRFEEPLRKAVDMNMLGTRRVMELSKKFERIEALIHVSTAYSNCNRSEIEEVIYPPPMSYEKVIDITRWLEPELIETITPSIIGDRPNTYTFTKALAENILDDERGSLPVAIIRPSIVTAVWKEPFPGWIDNLNGPTGVITAGGKGILRSFIADEEVIVDVIPVDVVADLMITVAWHTAVRPLDKVIVYHCNSGSLNSTTWSDIRKDSLHYVIKYPSAEVFFYPEMKYRRTRFSHYIHAAFLHFLIAFFVDAVGYLFFKKPWMIRLYKKIHRATDCLEYFTTREWKFHCNNILMLNNLLSKEDKEKFYIDIRPLNWSSFWENHVLGIRKFLLKEDPSTIPAARRKLKMRYALFQIGKVVVLVTAAWKFLFSEFL